MLTVVTLLKVHPSPNGHLHGERAFWRETWKAYLRTWLESTREFVPHPHRVVVMTDAEASIAPMLLDGEDSVALDSTVDAPGFWAKLSMFRPEVSTGKTLYLDLDNVINGPLDELCALEPDPLIMLDDRRVPGLPNGSAILFDAERCRHLWSEYVADKDWCERFYVPQGDDYQRAYDQAYIARGVQATFFQDELPEGYILNARSELPNAPDWRTARLVFGGGSEGKPHLSTHPAFSLR